MRCSKVQKLLSELHNGELSPHVESSILDHIAACPSCRAASAAYAEMMEMLANAEKPELPAGFEGSLHVRLATENARASELAMHPHRSFAHILRSGALVLVGGAAMAAFFLLRSGPAPETAELCPAPTSVATAQPGVADGALAVADLEVGEIAILTLTFEGAAEVRDAELEVVLPDGLALVGEGRQLLEEKVVSWTTTIDERETQIRIPVQAQRPGTWRLVARARVGDQDVTSEADLRVSQA